MTFEQFRKTYPCEIAKSDTVVNYSTYHDTLIIRKDCISEIAKLPNIQVKSIEVKGDSLVIISTHSESIKRVTNTIKDSSHIQGYINTIQGLEGRIKALETKEGDYILKIEKMKGSGRITLIMAIIPWIIVALVTVFFIYTWYHNKK
jgi:hypothetical protein